MNLKPVSHHKTVRGEKIDVWPLKSVGASLPLMQLVPRKLLHIVAPAVEKRIVVLDCSFGFRPLDRRDVRRFVSKVSDCAPCWLEFLLPGTKPVLDGLLVFGVGGAMAAGLMGI